MAPLRQRRRLGRSGSGPRPAKPREGEGGEAGQRHRPGRGLRHGWRKLGDHDLAVAGLDAGCQNLVQTVVERTAAASVTCAPAASTTPCRG
jgi:hypothetical protein